MTEEEFEQIKEAEKERLRLQKRLSALKQRLGRKQSVQRAVRTMAERAQQALDHASNLIDRLATKTAHDEAHVDVALDAMEDAPRDAQRDANVEHYESEQRAARARQLIRQYKQAQGTRRKSTPSPAASASAADKNTRATRLDDDLSTPPPNDLPEKTIGRMR